MNKNNFIQRKWAEKHPELLQGKCEYCGKEYTRKISHQRYCSQACAEGARNKHRLAKKQERVCPICGCTFETSDSRKVYCSFICKSKAWNDTHPGGHKKKALPGVHRIKYDPMHPRACHDCGQPTANYRCPKCLDKWRKKHGVEVGDGTNDADTWQVYV